MRCDATIVVAEREYRCLREVGMSSTGAVPIPHQRHEWRRQLVKRGVKAAVIIEWIGDAQ